MRLVIKRLCIIFSNNFFCKIVLVEDVGSKGGAFDMVSDGVHVWSTVRFTGAAETNVNFGDVYYYEDVASLVFGKVYGDLHEVAEA